MLPNITEYFNQPSVLLLRKIRYQHFLPVVDKLVSGICRGMLLFA